MKLNFRAYLYSSLALVVLILITSLFVDEQTFAGYLNLYLDPGRLDEMRQRIRSFGLWTPFAICLLHVLRAVIYFPEPLLMMATGFFFEPKYAIPIIVIGSYLAGSTVYLIVFTLKKMGKMLFLKRWFVGKKNLFLPGKNAGASQEWAYQILFAWRMLPLFPFFFLTYGSAFLGLSYARFSLAMTLGVIPSALFYTVLARVMLYRHLYPELSRSWQMEWMAWVFLVWGFAAFAIFKSCQEAFVP